MQACNSALLQCIELCVVMQYMVVYELFMTIADSVLFTIDGVRFSVVQVRCSFGLPCFFCMLALWCY